MRTTKLQNSTEFKSQNFFIGMDVHKRSWTITIRSMGIQIERFTQPPSVEALVTHLKNHYQGGEYYSAYEAGFCGTSIHEQLIEAGIKNIIVHAGDIPTTDKQKKNKTDLHDSRNIAEQLEKNNLHGIHVLTRQQQELRGLFRLRQQKVKDVTRMNNRLKGYLAYFAIQLPEEISKNDYLSKRGLDWLSNLELATEGGTLSLSNYVEELKHQRQQLSHITKMVRQQIQTLHGENYKLLLTVPGIGAVTAMGLLAEIADFKRFNDPDEYSSFLGLMPWEDSTGETIKTKGIQPRCNKWLRSLLIEASWMAIKKDRGLFAYFSKHAKKDSRKAIIKVTRKLALIAKGVVQKQQPYDTDYLKKRKEEQQQNEIKFFKGKAEKHIEKQPDNIPLPG
jgi:transposase